MFTIANIRKMAAHYIGKGKRDVDLYSASSRTPLKPLTLSDMDHTAPCLPLPVSIPQAALPHIYA